MSLTRLHWPHDQFRTCATRTRRARVFSTTHLSAPTMNKDTKKERKKSKVKDEQTGGENSKWSEADAALLVETMTLQKAEGGWGDNNPKPIAWTACEKALARSEKESGCYGRSWPYVRLGRFGIDGLRGQVNDDDMANSNTTGSVKAAGSGKHTQKEESELLKRPRWGSWPAILLYIYKSTLALKRSSNIEP